MRPSLVCLLLCIVGTSAWAEEHGEEASPRAVSTSAAAAKVSPQGPAREGTPPGLETTPSPIPSPESEEEAKPLAASDNKSALGNAGTPGLVWFGTVFAAVLIVIFVFT